MLCLLKLFAVIVQLASVFGGPATEAVDYVETVVVIYMGR